MTTTTLRSRKTRRPRPPITDKTRKPLPYSRRKDRLEKFIRMRKQSNVTFIVSFDGDDLLRRLMSQRSSENMQLFANNVHVFLRFYDFDGFDIYKIHFTGENVDVWTDLLKARQC
ncbi:uncharacterized protein LOC119393909 [Rhipicephalus sanguineus]|uniref:uncharacterized protein LOC119393909 n=1 Tax=Rhipicephalus sanguineus TaxID=34632 RepID=UPI0020C225B6|nr:uncharacterized protein LOC119393909 [Rhipicephalus sanguineus]